MRFHFYARPLSLAVFLSSAPLTPLALAQSGAPLDVEVSEVLSGRVAPLSLKLSELGPSWSEFELGDVLGFSLFAELAGAGRITKAAKLYTRGQTVRVNGEPFLVGYRLSLSPEQAQELSLGGSRFQSEAPPRLASSTPLVLSLVNVRQMSSMNSIRPFDASIIATPVDLQRGAEEDSVANLKQIGLGLLQYTQDYDEKLPRMTSASSMRQIQKEANSTNAIEQSVQAALYPYIKSTAIFAHPRTRELYRPNLRLSGRPLAHFANPSIIAAFYEASPASDGKRAVLYLSGRVERVAPEKWDSIRRLSKIPGRRPEESAGLDD